MKSFNTNNLENTNKLFSKKNKVIISLCFAGLLLLLFALFGGIIQAYRANSYIKYTLKNYTFGVNNLKIESEASICYKPGRKEPWSITKYCSVNNSTQYKITEDPEKNNQLLKGIYEKMQKDGLKNRYKKSIFDSRKLINYDEIKFSGIDKRTASGLKEMPMGLKCEVAIEYDSNIEIMTIETNCWYSGDYFIL